MKRFVCSMLVLGLALSLAPFAAAQGGPAVTGVGGEDRALGIQFYGDLDLQMRYGDSGFIFGRGIDVDADGNTDDDPAWIGSPKVRLGVKAQLADKASAVVELMLPRVDAGNNVNLFGASDGAGGIDIGVRQAYLKVEDALIQDLSQTFGVQELVFDVIGANNPLLLALGRSESATAEGLAIPGAANANSLDELPAGGLRIDYRLGEAGLVSVFHMIVDDNYLEDCEMVTGIGGTYEVTENTSVEGLISLINGAPGGDGKESEIWLIGIGAASNGEFVDGLNLFAQIGFNAGTYGRNGDESVDATGLMFDIGASYQLDMAFKPKFGLEYLYVSGNEDEAPDPEDDYQGFVSYEDNNDLIILEDKEFGWDVDQNYSVIKIRAAVTTDVAGPVKDNFTLGLTLGIAKLVEDIDTGTSTEDGLGTELDIKASWAASKNLTVYGGFGWLFGSDVLELYDEDMDSAFTYFLGTSVTF